MRNDLLNGKPVPPAPKPRFDPTLQYPRGVHHPAHGCRIVHTAEQATSLLADGWYETPADFPAVEPKGPEEGIDAAALRAQFDTAWKQLTAKHDDLRAAHQSLSEENARLAAANQELRDALDAAQAPQEAAKPKSKPKIAEK